MTDTELRHHAEDILSAVVHDMSIAQTDEEQSRKSQGQGSARTTELSGRLRADERIWHGFTFRAVLVEFRALRTTVLRRYEESRATDLVDVRRFNEAIDEAPLDAFRHFAPRQISPDERIPSACVSPSGMVGGVHLLPFQHGPPRSPETSTCADRG